MVSAEVQKLLDELPQLHARLQNAGFVPDASRWLAANDLLFHLYTQDRFPADAHELCRLLTPLFCSSADQQQDFGKIFGYWSGAPSELDQPAVAENRDAQWKRRAYESAIKWWPLLAGVAVVAMLVAGSYYAYLKLHPPVVHQPIAPPQVKEVKDTTRPTEAAKLKETGFKPQPIPPRFPEQFQLTQLNKDLSAITTVLLSTLLGSLPIVWVIRRQRLRRAIVRQQPGASDDPMVNLPLPRDSRMPFWSGPIPRVMHRLRRGAPMYTRQLDIDRTVDATVRQAGLFKPKPLYRRWRPEYVLLIEHRYVGDHIAGLAHSLVERLRQDGLVVQPYEFSGSPEIVFEKTPSGPRRHRLQGLHSRHPDARLIGIGDIEGMFEPIGGAPITSIFRSLEFWPSRAWLTSRAQPWTTREVELARRGFAVAPLLGVGVESIAGWLESPRRGVAPWFQTQMPDDYPPMLRFGIDQWLRRAPPDDDLTEEMIGQLRHYLGHIGTRLLRAMAAYPSIHIGLTIALDQKLFAGEGSEVREQRLLRLGRLPWCRRGRMPDFLRERLLRDLDEGERARIRDAYTAIFSESMGAGTNSKWTLPLRSAKDPTLRQRLRDMFRFARPGTPLDDQIFARLMLSERKSPLDFELPAALARSFPLRQWDVAPAAIALVLAAACGWATYRYGGLLVTTGFKYAVRAANGVYTVDIDPNQNEELAKTLRDSLLRWGYKVEPLAPKTGSDTKQVSANKYPTGFSVEYFGDKDKSAAEAIAQNLSYLIYGKDVQPSLAASSQSSAEHRIAVHLAATIPSGGVFRDTLTGTYTKKEVASQTAGTSPTPPDTQAKQQSTDDTSIEAIEPEMVAIHVGSFDMGSPDNEKEHQADESPVHSVKVPAFELGKYEVTFDEYDAYAKATKLTLPDDNGWGRGKRPVVNVTWDNAQDYIKWLNQRTGKQYRLPTEAEWEYAARAGTRTAFNTGDCLNGLQANIDSTQKYWNCPTDKEFFGKTREVGQYQPNAFALYDMHGNVWELTQDCYHDTYKGAPTDASAWEDAKGACDSGKRVLRGGSWFNTPVLARSACRGSFTTDSAYSDLGFRLARTLK